jgi:hypothetical protein
MIRLLGDISSSISFNEAFYFISMDAQMDNDGNFTETEPNPAWLILSTGSLKDSKEFPVEGDASKISQARFYLVAMTCFFSGFSGNRPATDTDGA